MKKEVLNIGVLGAGTWGIALATVLAKNKNSVVVWSAISEEIDELCATRKHKNLPDMRIPNNVEFVKDLAVACDNKDMLIVAVPSVFVRKVSHQLRDKINSETIVVSVSKGIEEDTLYTMTEVIRSEIGTNNCIVALSGPTHAEEVAMEMPSAIVSACDDSQASEFVQRIFINTCLRVYSNSDVLGVELCGAMKNIIALAVGIADGLGYGDNTKAAIITRGMAEISRLGKKIGCSENTFGGLAGIGDLIVTATSIHSRNNK